jgi:hypothetical protein
LKIQPEYKKGDNYFFLNEGTIKPSRKQGKGDVTLNEEKFDGDIENNPALTEPFEFRELSYLHEFATSEVEKLKDGGTTLKVTNIETYGEDIDEIQYFTIETPLVNQDTDDIESYTIYKIRNDVYYRPSDEFYQILKDFEDEVPGQTIESLKMDYLKNEPLDNV